MVGDSAGYCTFVAIGSHKYLGSLKTHANAVLAMQPIPGLGLLVCGTGSPMAIVDPQSMQVKRSFRSQSEGVYRIAWNKTERSLLTLGFSGRIFVWDPFQRGGHPKGELVDHSVGDKDPGLHVYTDALESSSDQDTDGVARQPVGMSSSKAHNQVST